MIFDILASFELRIGFELLLLVLQKQNFEIVLLILLFSFENLLLQIYYFILQLTI